MDGQNAIYLGRIISDAIVSEATPTNKDTKDTLRSSGEHYALRKKMRAHLAQPQHEQVPPPREDEDTEQYTVHATVYFEKGGYLSLETDVSILDLTREEYDLVQDLLHKIRRHSDYHRRKTPSQLTKEEDIITDQVPPLVAVETPVVVSDRPDQVERTMTEVREEQQVSEEVPAKRGIAEIIVSGLASEIAHRYQEEGLTYRALAREYNTWPTTIRNIIARATSSTNGKEEVLEPLESPSEEATQSPPIEELVEAFDQMSSTTEAEEVP